jgi:MSHA biogenesis protein MshO
VIYNLGITGADAYEGSNIYPLQTAGTLNKLSYAGGQFPLPSPSSRFYTVSGAASYACDMTNKQLLMYSDYAIANVQPSSVATLNSLASPRVLANNLSTCEISYTPGVLQRSGIVMVTLGFIQDTAKLSLMHLITIANSP